MKCRFPDAHRARGVIPLRLQAVANTADRAVRVKAEVDRRWDKRRARKKWLPFLISICQLCQPCQLPVVIESMERQYPSTRPHPISGWWLNMLRRRGSPAPPSWWAYWAHNTYIKQRVKRQEYPAQPALPVEEEAEWHVSEYRSRARAWMGKPWTWFISPWDMTKMQKKTISHCRNPCRLKT